MGPYISHLVMNPMLRLRQIHYSNSPIANLSRHFHFLSFHLSVFSLDYPKLIIIAYEETMPMSTSSL